MDAPSVEIPNYDFGNKLRDTYKVRWDHRPFCEYHLPQILTVEITLIISPLLRVIYHNDFELLSWTGATSFLGKSGVIMVVYIKREDRWRRELTDFFFHNGGWEEHPKKIVKTVLYEKKNFTRKIILNIFDKRECFVKKFISKYSSSWCVQSIYETHNSLFNLFCVFV